MFWFVAKEASWSAQPYRYQAMVGWKGYHRSRVHFGDPRLEKLDFRLNSCLSARKMCSLVLAHLNIAFIAWPRLSKAPVTFQGGLRDDSTGVHSFIFYVETRRHHQWFNSPTQSCPISPQTFIMVSVYLYLLVLFILLADLPHNVVVSETGRGSGGEIHPLDVIVLVKRYAADRDMCQDHA